jgi:hypothetical protein
MRTLASIASSVTGMNVGDSWVGTACQSKSPGPERGARIEGDLIKDRSAPPRAPFTLTPHTTPTGHGHNHLSRIQWRTRTPSYHLSRPRGAL